MSVLAMVLLFISIMSVWVSGFFSRDFSRNIRSEPMTAPNIKEAMADLIALCERNIYPQPDKPGSDWARVEAAKSALTTLSQPTADRREIVARDEDAIRADERERCAAEIERRNWPCVGDAKRIAANIRALDGGR